MGKGLKEFQLCDSRRLRKKPQDAQDDVTELFDLFDAHFWGWKGIQNLDSQRRSSPVVAMEMLKNRKSAQDQAQCHDQRTIQCKASAL